MGCPTLNISSLYTVVYAHFSANNAGYFLYGKDYEDNF